MIGFTRDVNVSRSVLAEIKLQVDSRYTLPKALAAFLVSSFMAVWNLPLESNRIPKYLKCFTVVMFLPLYCICSFLNVAPALLNITVFVFSTFSVSFQSEQYWSTISICFCKPCLDFDISNKSSAQNKQGTLLSFIAWHEMFSYPFSLNHLRKCHPFSINVTNTITSKKLSQLYHSCYISSYS